MYRYSNNKIKDARITDRKYKYLYSKMLDETTIRNAWNNLRKGKTKRKAVIRIEANFDAEVKAMQERIRNTKPDGYNVEHPELAYEPPVVRKTKLVHEFGKQRIAYLADIREQWYFHIIVEVLKLIMMPRLEKGVCGCIPGRGMHSGKKIVENTIEKEKNIRYFFKCDVRHFYANVQIKYVIQEMRHLIDDDLFLYCIEKIYKYQKKGILIGLYISPWISNFLLMHLDTTLSRDKRFTYIRYVDDITVFANSKKDLREAYVITAKILGSLRLRLKKQWQICKFDYVSKKTKIVNGIVEPIRIGRSLDFLGFVFYRDRTVIRKKILIDSTKMARKIHKIKKQKRLIWNKMARGFISRMGWFTWTDTYYCYLKWIKPYVQISYIRHIISKLDKEVSKNGRKLEKRDLCCAT